jgi:hypothetical protein
MEFVVMARDEVTGKKPAQTADQVERPPGPPRADPTEIEPSENSELNAPLKAKAARIRGPPSVPAAWYSLEEFAVAHRLSLAMLFKLKAEGRGPREIAVGSRRFVTFEDAAEWRAAQQKATAA